MKRFTPKEDKFIKDNFFLLTGEEIAKKLNRYFTSIFQRAKLLGLVLPEEIKTARRKKITDNLLIVGKPFRFEKEHTPSNKGKTWDEYMPKECQENSLKENNKEIIFHNDSTKNDTLNFNIK